MDDNLAAEIARIEAELEADRQFRELQQRQQQQQQQQQQPFGAMDATSAFERASAAENNPHPAQRQRMFAHGGDPMAAQQQQPGVMAPTSGQPHQFSKDSDGRSIFVGNLPRGENGGPTTTPEELAQFFADCGQILNCTVLRDRGTGELKGTAYVEFASYTAMGKAIDTKNNASFKGSTIIVTKKRSAFRPDRARGGRGGRGGGVAAAADPYQAMMALMGMMAGGAMMHRSNRGGGGGGGRGGRGRGAAGVYTPAAGGFQPFQ